MMYVGIMGALSPLGIELARVLTEKADFCRVVFYCDAGYKVNSPAKATYATPEAALSFNQPPTLVVDCDDPATAIKRAEIYRFYAVNAIMCCTCKPQELEDLSSSFVAENQPEPALLITPDYCVNFIRLLNFFLRIADKHKDDVDHVEIGVGLPPQKKVDLERWLYFADRMNEQLGKTDAKRSVKGNTCCSGYVQIKVMSDETLASEAEEAHVRLFYGKKESMCYTYMKTLSKDRIKDSVDGIEMMLKWFAEHPAEIFSGGVLSDHLSKLVFPDKKNLR